METKSGTDKKGADGVAKTKQRLKMGASRTAETLEAAAARLGAAGGCQDQIVQLIRSENCFCAIVDQSKAPRVEDVSNNCVDLVSYIF
jgi:hypothetical protein